jgi:hypothetical protein
MTESAADTHKVHERRLVKACEPTGADPWFLRSFFATFALVVVLVAGVSIAVDPFARFGVGWVPPVVWMDRDAKAASFERTSEPPQQIILGSSRIMKANPMTLEGLTGMRTFNFGVNSARAEDLLAIASFAIAEDADVRTLLVGVDPEAFASVPVDQRLLGSRALGSYVPDRPWPWEGLGADIMSMGALSSDLRSLRHEYGGVREPETSSFRSDGFITYLQWEQEQRDGTFSLQSHVAESVTEYRARFAGFDRLDGRRVGYFRAMLELAQEHDVRVVTFILPLHPELEEALVTATWAARRADTAQMLRMLSRESLCTQVQVDGLVSFGGTPDGFFDGAHMDEANTERLVRFVLEQARALQ